MHPHDAGLQHQRTSTPRLPAEVESFLLVWFIYHPSGEDSLSLRANNQLIYIQFLLWYNV